MPIFPTPLITYDEAQSWRTEKAREKELREEYFRAKGDYESHLLYFSTASETLHEILEDASFRYFGTTEGYEYALQCASEQRDIGKEDISEEILRYAYAAKNAQDLKSSRKEIDHLI